jgi:hypothetical protein
MKNNNNLNTPIKYKIYNVLPRMYFVQCEDQFDLNMLFARFQEFYESDNPNIKGKKFEFMKWVRWYTQKKGTQKNLFTYTDDWAGFNIPSDQIDLCLKNIDTNDFNMYDVEMNRIVRKIREFDNHTFYLIGATKFESHAFKHEIAHGFYFINDNMSFFNKKNGWMEQINYRKFCDLNIKKVPASAKKKMYALLKEYGYNKSVFDDEFQAFMSTGLTDIMVKKAPELKTHMKDFKKTFNAFFKTTPINKKLIGSSPLKLNIESPGYFKKINQTPNILS